MDVAPTLLDGGEGPWSEGSTVLSSDDILPTLRVADYFLHVQNTGWIKRHTFYNHSAKLAG